MKLKWLSGLACLVLGTVTVYGQTAQNNDLKPTGKGWGERGTGALPAANPAAKARAGSNGISYHGGPVMTSGPNVYYIWYGWGGSYADAKAESILTNLVSTEGGSPYFNINSSYYNGSNVHVTNAVHYKGSTVDNYSQGKSLSDASIQTIVKNALPHLGVDTNAVYFVLTSADVNETSGFCTQYCGWHTSGSINGSDIKYAFVGNPARCLSACAAQTTSPNGTPGGDGMASIVAHELEEATTDPDLNAWYDSRGEENADKCAWTFGTESTASNGSKYNVVFGGTQYLIQRNWVNASGGYCSMSY
jgi:Phosphate-induced protein 1 conserved region